MLPQTAVEERRPSRALCVSSLSSPSFAGQPHHIPWQVPGARPPIISFFPPNPPLQFIMLSPPSPFPFLYPSHLSLPSVPLFSGEHAFVLMMHRNHYPSTLFDLQDEFGREETQLCRIYNWAIHFVYDNHGFRVHDNVGWYSCRFDMYNDAYRRKIAESAFNPTPGQVPANLDDIFASLDCTARPICRPSVSLFL